MLSVKQTTQAYCKMVLYGAKCPYCVVDGLLVAEKQKSRKEQSAHGDPKPHHPPLPQTLFVACIPLFHGTLALAPMLEVALTLTDSWCKDNSYMIAGYYQTNERVKDASPNQIAEKVASRIAEGCNDTALLMVDNTKFTMECIEPRIHVYEHHENKWRCRDPHYDYCEDWPEAQQISHLSRTAGPMKPLWVLITTCRTSKMIGQIQRSIKLFYTYVRLGLHRLI